MAAGGNKIRSQGAEPPYRFIVVPSRTRTCNLKRAVELLLRYRGNCGLALFCSVFHNHEVSHETLVVVRDAIMLTSRSMERRNFAGQAFLRVS